jgi:hypothetical protein
LPALQEEGGRTFSPFLTSRRTQASADHKNEIADIGALADTKPAAKHWRALATICSADNVRGISEPFGTRRQELREAKEIGICIGN